jgi:hypothetical protein
MVYENLSFEFLFIFFRDKKMFSNDDILNYDKKNLFDPTGPGPASYYVPRRPPNEKVSPSFSFGKRCLVEKSELVIKYKVFFV